MDSLMAETVQEKHWYLAVGDRSIGPLTTGLVARGIQSGKVPLTAWICQVGANSWSALSSFGEFQDVVDRVLAAEVPANQQQRERPSSSGPATPSEASPSTQPSAVERPAQSGELASATVAGAALTERQVTSADEEEPTGRRSFLPYEQAEDRLPSFVEEVGESDFVTSVEEAPMGEPAIRQDLPSFTEQSGQRAVPPDLGVGGWSLSDAPRGADYAARSDEVAAAARAASRVSHDDLGIDITFDEDHANSIDWKERFQSYFLVGTEVELPDERKLLQSLREAPRAVFMHDEALWNLSLCLAYGSEEVANTSARTFFEIVVPDQGSERIEWICRTLLSKGFMPSGIPRSDGMRGIDILRVACPHEFSDLFEREAVD